MRADTSASPTAGAQSTSATATANGSAPSGTGTASATGSGTAGTAPTGTGAGNKRGKKSGKACLLCRKAKRQCIKNDLESTTCQRCTENQLDCVYEESLEGNGQARVELLERRLAAMQEKLESLSRASVGATAAVSSGQDMSPLQGSVQPPPHHHHQPHQYISPNTVQSQTHFPAPSTSNTNPSSYPINSPKTWQATQLLDHLSRGTTGSGGHSFESDDITAEHNPELEQEHASLNAPYQVIADASNRPNTSAQATRASTPVTGAIAGGGHGEAGLGHRPLKRLRSSREEQGSSSSLAGATAAASTHADAVQTGLVSEHEARQLFRGWMDLAREYVPILDPYRDTFERTRARAPLVLDAILAISLCTQEAPDDRAQVLLDNTLQQVSNGLFAGSNSVSELQALVILSTWHHHAYLSVGHGMRLAHSLKLPASVDRLLVIADQRAHRSRTDIEREEEARLLAETRLFGHLWFMDISQSTMRNLPICNYGNEAVFIEKLRQVIRHPAAITSDIRTTAMLENTAFRKQVLLSFPNPRSVPDIEVVQKTSQFLGQADQWYAQWDGQLFLPADSFPRCSLRRCAANTKLMIVCHCLGHYLRKQRTNTLPERILELLRRGQYAAEESVDIAITSSAYTSTWRQAGHPTLVDFAYSGILALRLVRLLGNTEELNAVFRKIESLIELFRRSDDPFGCMKALQYAYRRIRRKASREESPTQAGQLPFADFQDMAALAATQPTGQGGPDSLYLQTSMFETQLPSASLMPDPGNSQGHATFPGLDNDDFWSRMLRDIEQDIASQNDQNGFPQSDNLDFWSNENVLAAAAPGHSSAAQGIIEPLPLGGAWGPW